MQGRTSRLHLFEIKPPTSLLRAIVHYFRQFWCDDLPAAYGTHVLGCCCRCSLRKVKADGLRVYRVACLLDMLIGHRSIAALAWAWISSNHIQEWCVLTTDNILGWNQDVLRCSLDPHESDTAWNDESLLPFAVGRDGYSISIAINEHPDVCYLWFPISPYNLILWKPT